jgi:hypothetical protein
MSLLCRGKQPLTAVSNSGRGQPPFEAVILVYFCKILEEMYTFANS